MRTYILVALLAVAVSAHGTPSDPPAGNTFERLTYREYMSLDTEARRQVFNKISLEKKVELVRAQVECWREAHRKELNEDQLASIDEMLTAIDAELYAAQKSPEKQLQMHEIIGRVNVRFTPEQIRELVLLESKQ
jgi:hypothetical protein